MDWPILGEFELATAMMFDLGDYTTVVAATLLLHVLHFTDEDELIKDIKERYEQPLKEIFQ